MRPSMTFSRVVMCGSTRTSWNVRAIRARQTWNDCKPINSLPRNRIAPLSGANSAVMRLSTVVLPEPFGPIRPMICPCGISKEMIAHGNEAAECLAQPANAEEDFAGTRHQ